MNCNIASNSIDPYATPQDRLKDSSGFAILAAAYKEAGQEEAEDSEQLAKHLVNNLQYSTPREHHVPGTCYSSFGVTFDASLGTEALAGSGGAPSEPAAAPGGAAVGSAAGGV